MNGEKNCVSSGMVEIFRFSPRQRRYTVKNGGTTVPDFALIPDVIEKGLEFKPLWAKVLEISGKIIKDIPNLVIVEEPNITPPRISLHSTILPNSEILDSNDAIPNQAGYLREVFNSFSGSNLRTVFIDNNCNMESI
jgi:hypothetical protein